jgi:hypothetical protein
MEEQKMKKIMTVIAAAAVSIICGAQDNLFQNADFSKTNSEGKLLNWTPTMDKQEPFKVEKGTITIPATVVPPHNTKTKWGGLQQLVDVGAGKYKLLFSVNVQDVDNLLVRFLKYDPSTGNVVKVGEESKKTENFDGDGKWEAVSIDFTLPEKCVKLQLMIDFTTDAGENAAVGRVKDLKLVKVEASSGK